jgi:ribonuclease HIII
VDLYPGCTAGDIRVTDAESKYLAVAAASILARNAALDQFAQLEAMAGFPIPKGSSLVAPALNQLKASGLESRLLRETTFQQRESGISMNPSLHNSPFSVVITMKP